MFGTLVIQTREKALESASTSSRSCRTHRTSARWLRPSGRFRVQLHPTPLWLGVGALFALSRSSCLFLILQDLAWKLFPPYLPLSLLPAPSSLPSWNLQRSGIHVISYCPNMVESLPKKKKSSLCEDFEWSSRFKRICQPSRYLTAYHCGQNSLITEIGQFFCLVIIVFQFSVKYFMLFAYFWVVFCLLTLRSVYIKLKHVKLPLFNLLGNSWDST